jgi:glycosyltransferase involved in cell wall biosynthesis
VRVQAKGQSLARRKDPNSKFGRLACCAFDLVTVGEPTIVSSGDGERGQTPTADRRRRHQTVEQSGWRKRLRGLARSVLARDHMPNVTVIMPCFNHARFLTDSVNSILRQTYLDLELIVVDDCSTDASWQIIEKFATHDARVKGVRHEHNEGPSRSRNDGLRAASGQFIGFCDSDDVWESEKLTTEIDLLRNNAGYGVVYSDARIIDEEGQLTGKRFSELFPLPKPSSGWLFPELAKRNFMNIQSVVMRMECAQRVGLFDEGVKYIEDWWYWVQLSREYRFFYCEVPLCRYRMHSGSTSLVHQRAYSTNRLKVFRRILQNYGEISPSVKADIVYEMGVDLCRLGKYRFGQRFFWRTMRLAIREPELFTRFCKAVFRLCLCSVRA